eukprot:scaffold64057_cov38-Cyclotella_meneghiniana.AAC.4
MTTKGPPPSSLPPSHTSPSLPSRCQLGSDGRVLVSRRRRSVHDGAGVSAGYASLALMMHDTKSHQRNRLICSIEALKNGRSRRPSGEAHLTRRKFKSKPWPSSTNSPHSTDEAATPEPLPSTQQPTSPPRYHRLFADSAVANRPISRPPKHEV